MLIREIKKDNRPREQVINRGIDSLSNEDLLAILIQSGTLNKSSKDIALELLSSVDNLVEFKDFTINRLLEFKGIGHAKAIFLLASIELGRRIFRPNVNVIGKRFCSSSDIYESVKNLWQDVKQECFMCMYLNNKNELIERKILFMGTINKSVVHPREIFKYAYLLSSSKIVCLHNHPSGDVTPSREDVQLTEALVEIGKIQNIPVLDHIIVGNDAYYSFSDNGMIL